MLPTIVIESKKRLTLDGFGTALLRRGAVINCLGQN